MASYIIEILDQDLKSKARGRHEIDFDDDTTAQEAIQSIVHALELPHKDARGEDRRYLLGFEGEALNPGEVIAHRVPGGATLMLTSDASVAGARCHER